MTRPDKRSSVRRSVAISAVRLARIQSGVRTAVEAGSVKNLSLCGACVETEAALEPGQPVSVDLQLPAGAGHLTLCGVVRWCHQPTKPLRLTSEPQHTTAHRVGVAFVAATMHDQTRLTQFFEQHLAA